jgi:hypothetical protein
MYDSVVLMRLALILAMLVQPLLVVPAAGARAAAAGCSLLGHESSCCRMVVRTTCCGERTVDRRCRMSEGEACRCAAGPGEGKRPRGPEAPPGQGEQLRLALGTASPLPVSAVAEAGGVRAAVSVAPAAGGVSHNVKQAFLGVWRT